MGNICVVSPLIGFQKNPFKKNTLRIDKNVDFVVKKIFELYASGHGSLEIIRFLTKKNFLSPKGYQKTGVVADEELAKEYRWNGITILNMLRNEVYIGNTVQNKTTVISYKIKKLRKNEKENYIRVKNTHEAIIDQDVFEKVNRILEKRGTNRKLKYDYLFRDFLFCYHCKRKLQVVLKSNARKKSIKYPYITCVRYRDGACYVFSMNYNKAEQKILKTIKEVCKTYASHDDFYKAYEEYNKQIENSNEQVKKELAFINKRLKEIEDYLEKMYIDKLRGILPEESYRQYSQKIMTQKEILESQKSELEKEEKREKSSKDLETNLNQMIEEFWKFDFIHSSFLDRMIKKIEIDKNKNIYVYFNFSKPES